MATHSSILAWRIPWTEEPGRLQSVGSQSQTRLSDYHFHFQVWLRGSHSERLQETGVGGGGGSCRLCLHCLIWVWVT